MNWLTLLIRKLIANSPDIILLHIGSNDWSESISGLNRILAEIARYEINYQHPIKVILARIINRKIHYPWISNYNRNVQSLANSRIRAGDDIVVIDMEYGARINYATEFQDPTHPNARGYEKMANVWFNTLKNILKPMPSAPSAFESISIKSDGAVLSWSDTSNNETGFRLYQNAILLATLPANSTQYTVEGLQRVSTYDYTLVAYNNEGESNPAALSLRTKDNYGWLVPIIYIIQQKI
ncbi:MAG: hypothetical protein Q9M36_08190 [Sulfurovum sp.]|nr:hypothetical protein [Sulfurovum sp.]